jgi:hypothetical protein
MSRPPTPHPSESTGRDQTGDRRTLDYLPLAYADLLALEQELAVTRLGRPRAQTDAAEEADVAETFMELSALVGHVLSVYQRYQAGEAYISTARSASSLVRHAHRLAYDPDPGLAASGFVVLVAKEHVGGTVAAGLPLASVPLGEIKAQDYETRDDLLVDAALNELRPARSRKSVEIAHTAREVRVRGTGHGLETGNTVALVGPIWAGFVVESAVEDEARGVTIVRFDRGVGATIAVDPDHPPKLLAHPAVTLRPFGSDADATLFPPAGLKSDHGAKPGGSVFPKYWYDVQRADGGGYDAGDIYLSAQVSEPLVGEYVLRSTGADFALLKATAAVIAAVTFNREAEETFATQTVSLTKSPKGFESSLKPVTGTQTVTGHVAATVTAMRAVDRDGTEAQRPDQPVPAQWLTGWKLELELASDEPNPEPVGESLELPGLLPALTPGRPLVYSTLDDTTVQVVAVQRAEFVANVTKIWWDPVTPAPTGGWRLDDLKVLGNVARASHGRSVQETLGGSDGVSPFQRFALGESPLTFLPGVAGGEPELEVRVDDVLWERVQDFANSGPDDRHYRSVTDEARVTSVVFGDGRNGAVPPSGKKNVTAVYRVGLGRTGDVEPRRLSRLKRAHPLLDRVVNLTPVTGGAEPADATAIRSQSTRWIRTFDRAVSVSDLADLALTMPGIARAASRWDQSVGAVLVVATAAGDPPPALDAVRAFLDARRDVTVPLELKGPRPRAVRMIVVLEPDPAFLLELVKNGVRAALYGDDEVAPGMFTFPARELGQPAFRSEVYERLEAVPGVIGVRVTGFQADGTDPVASVITAGVDEWLRLAPSDLTLSTIDQASPA